MNFDDKLKQAINIDDSMIDESQFLDKLHEKQQLLLLRQTRVNSSIATAAFLFLFGWASFSQLDNVYEVDDLYSFDHEFIYVEEIDTLEYEIYIDDLALYLVEEEDDIFSVLEFFDEVGFDLELNNKGDNL